MNAFAININRAKDLAAILNRMNYTPERFDDITPFQNDRFLEMHFIFFLTAIDHSTHGRSRYEAMIDGEIVHGSDLLYEQAREAAVKDPDLFTPSRMVAVSEGYMEEMFTVNNRTPVGMPERTRLLHDAARILLEQYSGDLQHLFESAGGYLRRQGGNGILDLLKGFRAYEDPLEKKSFLLIKLLRRRGLLDIRDVENIEVPVDYVLFTIALRSGLIVPDESMRAKILSKIVLSEEEVNELRAVTLKAFHEVANFAGMSPDMFDDLLWAYGRECLKYPSPIDRSDIENIRIDLNERLGDKDVLVEFVQYISGLNSNSPEGSSMFPVPLFPQTAYF